MIGLNESILHGEDARQDAKILPLRDNAARVGFSIGTAIDLYNLGVDAVYDTTIAREFNMCVAENHFKPGWVWTGPEEYNFKETDRLMDFAAKNNMVVRGHTLVWHSGFPHWLANSTYAADDIRVLLRKYIHAIVGRYRGKIKMWDVVNEAIDDGDGNPMRDTFWLRKLGKDYLRTALEFAEEADPDVSLYYNDYEAEEVGPKSNAVYDLVAGLKKSGVPIHGVGLQCHFINGWRVSRETRDNVRRIEDLGLKWQATEVDVRLKLDGRAATEAELNLQADAYRDLLDLCLSSSSCEGLIVWGFTDAHSWIPGFRPGWGASLPIDEEYRPKPAYDAMNELLASRR